MCDDEKYKQWDFCSFVASSNQSIRSDSPMLCLTKLVWKLFKPFLLNHPLSGALFNMPSPLEHCLQPPQSFYANFTNLSGVKSPGVSYRSSVLQAPHNS